MRRRTFLVTVAAGLAAVAVHPALVKSAEAVAQQMAARQGDVPDSEVADSEYAGGTIYTTARGNQLKDAKSFARFVIGGTDPLAMDPKFTHIGVGIALDGDSTPYTAAYFGHP